MAVVSTIFFILLCGDFFWSWRAITRLRRLPDPWAGVTIALVALFACLQSAGLAFLFFGRRMDLPFEEHFPQAIIAIVYLWHCLILLPVILLWFATRVIDAVVGIVRFLTKTRRPGSAAVSQNTGGTTRREFVAAAITTAPAILAGGATTLASEQWNQFRIRQVTAAIPRLPRALDGLTIAQVCDLHVGIFTHGAVLDRLVEVTNGLQPDLVMLPGDLINYSLTDLPVALETVKRLESRCGTFVCEGNHDLFEDPRAFREQTRTAGLRLLVNETAIVPVRDIPVQILGLRWGAGGADPHAMSNRGDDAISSSMKELLTLRQPDAFPILLAHHPHAFDFAGDIPLTLSGHTHGGQLMLTPDIGFGPALFRYWSGMYQKGDRSLIVSNGVGNWFPLRVRAPAEIVHVTLRTA